MPIYTYECDICCRVVDALVSYEDRDGDRNCSECPGAMVRHAVSGFQAGKPRFQTQAVLGNGAHIKGHFGKDARRRRR